MTPKRIKLQRKKGYKLSELCDNPNGYVIVDRRSKWGNRYRVGDPHPGTGEPMTAAQAVRLFESELEFWKTNDTGSFEFWISPLRGMDIVDWCDLDAPCHGDVLLRMANED